MMFNILKRILSIFRRSKPHNILFVCTGNTCRSPMAEAYLRDIAKRHHIGKIDSAGLWANPQDKISMNAIRALRMFGIPVDGYRAAKPFTADLASNFDMIIGMTKGHKMEIQDRLGTTEGVYTLAELAGEDRNVPDPFNGSLSQYVIAFTTIRDLTRVAIRRM